MALPGCTRARVPRRGPHAAPDSSTVGAAPAWRRSPTCTRATLDRIEEPRFDVFGGPPRLSPLTKVRIVGTGLTPVRVAVVGGGLRRARQLRSSSPTRAREVDTARSDGPTAGGRRRQTLPARDGDPRAAARQRPAHRARLLHRVPAASSTVSARALVPAALARAAGDRRGRTRSRDQPLAGCRSSVTATSRSASGCRRRERHAHCRSSGDAERRRSARCCAARRLGRVDRALLGRLRAPRSQPAHRRGERRMGVFTVRTALLGKAAASRRDPPDPAAR